MPWKTRYPLSEVEWMHSWLKDYIALRCDFPPDLHHLSWSALQAFLSGLIDYVTYLDYFAGIDPDLRELGECIVFSF